MVQCAHVRLGLHRVRLSTRLQEGEIQTFEVEVEVRVGDPAKNDEVPARNNVNDPISLVSQASFPTRKGMNHRMVRSVVPGTGTHARHTTTSIATSRPRTRKRGKRIDTAVVYSRKGEKNYQESEEYYPSKSFKCCYEYYRNESAVCACKSS